MGLMLTLLGPFQAAEDGVPLRGLAGSRTRALLAYLAVEINAPHPREVLAALLWPEQPDVEALGGLRRTLSVLRRVLGEEDRQPSLLLIDREAIQFNPAADCDLDVARYAQALSTPPTTHRLPLNRETMDRLERGVSLYRGELLEGLAVRSAPFEEWLLVKREQFHWQAMGALRLLAETYEALGEYRQAERCARHQLELQPWQEEAHRQLMRALALGGQRSAALAQYQTCVQRLDAELGVAPADETVALYEGIRDGRLREVEIRRQGDRETGKPNASRRVPPSPLPLFVGREAELGRLDRFLEMALAGQGRVAFVSGQAGSGKTALLAQFSQRAMVRHRELVAAGGDCSAFAGSGDPYLPFREILQLLSGEIEPHRAGSGLGPEHARRLSALMPATVQALVTLGPDLVGTFVPGEPLLRRSQALAAHDTVRWERLEALAQRPMEGEGGPRSSVYPPLQADLFEQVTRVLQALMDQQPLLLLLDDLQWADRGTLGLLFHLGRHLGQGRILILGAYRPATVALGSPSPGAGEGTGLRERHPLEPLLHEFGRHWGEIQVDLDQTDGRAFIEAFLDAEPNRLSPAFRETLYHHTGGNPLFTIEFLRSLQDRGDLIRDGTGRWVAQPVLHWGRLPARVEAVIAERFGRLPSECQALLQAASVEGEEFTAEVLARVASLGLPEVIRCLSETLTKKHRLVLPAHLLRREPGGQALSRYRFAHSLFQNYIYDQLDEVARAYLHRAVAETLEALSLAEDQGEVPSVQDPTAPARLAWHWEAAGQFDHAAACRLRAGRRAVQLSAYHEAVQQFRQGLVLLERIPEGSQHTELEKQILIGLLRPLSPTQGWASAERAELAQRALDLARKQPISEADLIAAIYARAEILSTQGKHAEALDLAELLLYLAQRSENPAYIALGYCMLGDICVFSGDMAGSIPHLQQALALYDHRRHAPLLPWTDGDLGVRCLGLLALALWCAGYADQGARCSRQALIQAQELGHPLTEAIALNFAGCAFHAMGLETRPVQGFARRLVALSEQKGLPIFRPYGLIYQGWAEALDGGGEQAVAQMRKGLAEWRATGHRSGLPFLVMLLAQALLHSGACDEALSTVEEGLGLAAEISPAFQAELFRLKGELLCNSLPPDPNQTEACFRMAITEARQRGTRLLELRAATSLARLWAQEGRQAEARQVLTEIYPWFSEGFETPDLRAARALLDTLDLAVCPEPPAVLPSPPGSGADRTPARP